MGASLVPGGASRRPGSDRSTRLLHLRHVDLRVASEHLVHRRRAALVMTDDEEVRHAAALLHSLRRRERPLDIAVIPKADEIAVQILAERHHLGLETPAQLLHQLIIDRAGSAKTTRALGRVQSLAAQALAG